MPPSPHASSADASVKGLPSLTWRQAIAWRLARHHLRYPAPLENVAAVADDICGLSCPAHVVRGAVHVGSGGGLRPRRSGSCSVGRPVADQDMGSARDIAPGWFPRREPSDPMALNPVTHLAIRALGRVLQAEPGDAPHSWGGYRQACRAAGGGHRQACQRPLERIRCPR